MGIDEQDCLEERHIKAYQWDNNILDLKKFPDSKVHGANMGPIWVLSAPGGPHVGPMNLAIRGALIESLGIAAIA